MWNENSVVQRLERLMMRFIQIICQSFLINLDLPKNIFSIILKLNFIHLILCREINFIHQTLYQKLNYREKHFYYVTYNQSIKFFHSKCWRNRWHRNLQGQSRGLCEYHNFGNKNWYASR